MPDLFGAESEPPPPPQGPGLFGAAGPPPEGGPGLFGSMPEPAPEGPAKVAAYRVLARKYRPAGFDALIGQEGMKRVLTRSFEQGRIAHAWVLTGVRGVGKTTTARILARALNCLGEDGQLTRPTIAPCGVCANCRAIAADSHPDVIELDAATHTGVDNVRELNQMVQYRPVSARYRLIVYDEAHMLSPSSWNALLKTLEEPPSHTKFAFATTEVRKIPLTVLSRCQRFDLRRIPEETLAEHYAGIAAKEGIAVEAGAIAMLARAADGSVRDGLSLLDQAIASAEEGAAVSADAVRAMLGLADRAALFDLFEAVMGGRIAEALSRFAAQHEAGAEPLTVIEDLLTLTHFVTLSRIEPRTLDRQSLTEAERTRGAALAKSLPVPALARAWQMLLKGFSEVREASDRKAAAEMVLIRLAHAADLPSPAELVRRLSAEPASASPAPPAPPPGGGGLRAVAGGAPLAAAASPAALPQAAAAAASAPVSKLGDVVALARARRDALLASQIMNAVHLIRLEPPLLEFRPAATSPRDLSARIAQLLTEATGTRWTVAIGQQQGEPTLADQDRRLAADRRAAVLAHPLVETIMKTFPGAVLEAMHPARASEPPPPDVDITPEPPPTEADPFGEDAFTDPIETEEPDPDA
ncbi:MAG: DNA polymerase III subunit gamma/tau [Acetobacteraceae bacterium]|nr:DNA polymerase III subunit gamma/tau [Acetobacteraceae bacterium]